MVYIFKGRVYLWYLLKKVIAIRHVRTDLVRNTAAVDNVEHFEIHFISMECSFRERDPKSLHSRTVSEIVCSN